MALSVILLLMAYQGLFLYNAPYYKVNYSVDDISIIRVNKTGIVTAKGIGTKTVTVSCQGLGFSVEAHVVV